MIKIYLVTSAARKKKYILFAINKEDALAIARPLLGGPRGEDPVEIQEIDRGWVQKKYPFFEVFDFDPAG
jgi:chemotaxis protein CheY-P-specific phosphatase CheC